MRQDSRTTFGLGGLVFALAAWMAPSMAEARDLKCVSAGYCVNDLTCNEKGAGETLSVKLLKGNRAQFGWSENAQFVAEGIRKKGFTVYVSTSRDTSIQTFVLAEDMTGTMGVTSIILDRLYSSTHQLRCREVRN